MRTSLVIVGMNSRPLPPSSTLMSPPAFVCSKNSSYRNSCSSRGVMVASGVIQCGCEALAVRAMLAQVSKKPYPKGVVPILT